MLLLSLFLACTGDTKDDTGEAAPSLTFLTPTATDTLAIGPISASVIVENFALEAPAKHNEGEAEGYISVTVDGAEVLTTAETQFSVTIDTAGSHTLGAELLFADGDALEPPVSDEVTITVE